MSYMRVAIAQINYHDAYHEKRLDYLTEPISLAPEDPGLYLFEGSSDVADLRSRLRKTYIKQHTAKLLQILQWAQSRNIHLLVFPEYSVPAESLPELAYQVLEAETVLVAGSHSVSNTSTARQAYSEIGITVENDTFDPGTDVRRSIAPVLFPDGSYHLIYKYQRSKYEGDMELGKSPWDTFTVNYDGKTAQALCVIIGETVSNV